MLRTVQALSQIGLGSNPTTKSKTTLGLECSSSTCADDLRYRSKRIIGDEQTQDALLDRNEKELGVAVGQ